MSSIVSGQLILLTLAIPFHLLLLVTLWRYRNKTCFKSAFFKLLFSLTTNDLLFCLFYVPFGLWMHNGGLATDPSLAATVDSLIGSSGYNANIVGLAAIATNRFVNLVWYMKAAQIWTERTTKAAMILQWLVFLAFLASFLHPDTHLKNLGVDSIEFVAPNSTILLAFQVSTLVLNFSCAAVVILCYTACFLKLIHHHLTTTSTNGDLSAEIKLFAQGFILSSFVTVSFVCYVVMIFICDGSFCNSLHSFLGIMSFYGNFYTGSVIALAMSGELRKHAKIVLVCNGHNQVGVGIA